jgi:Family of unknown function (DUF5906)
MNPFDRPGQERPSNVNPFDKSGRGHPSNPSGPPKPDANKPTAIPPEFDNIPPELRALPNWLLWQYLPPEKPGKKWRKVPFQPNGRPASTTKPNTWNTFDACCAAYEHGKFDGIGFVFDGAIGSDGLCYAGIDFDDCISSNNDSEKIDPIAQKRIEQLNTYTEQSPSGKGIHCIARSEPLTMGKHDGVEIYSKARYFTVTGHGKGKIRNATTELQAIAADAQAKEAEAKQNKRTNKLVVLDGGKTDNDDKSLEQKTVYWFNLLQPEDKDTALEHALECIAKNSKLLEREEHGGSNAEYHNLVTAIARSGAPHAEDIFVKYASTATEADSEDKLRDHFARCQASPPPSSGRPITVGTLIYIAQQQGADFEPWRRLVPDLPILPPHLRPSLKGGLYSPDEGLELFNSHFLIGRRDKEAAGVHRINDDGSLTYLKAEYFKLEVQHISVIGQRVLADTFWKSHRQRHQRIIVFKPGGILKPNEYNLWRGFGVEPREGQKKMHSLLRHITSVICRNNMTKIRYLMKWLAWKVQNPDKHPETVIVIKGQDQGTGKTLLSDVMRRIFGDHATVITDKEQLFGKFTEFLEPICFLQIEEALWAGDPRIADKSRHFITGDLIPIERKFGPRFTIPNRLASIITTNYQHAVALGVRDRRYVVYEIDPKFVGNENYFNRLWRDINDGGIEEFLYLLLNAPIRDWHPRQIIKTEEAIEEQRMSADSISQWTQECIDDDGISLDRGPYGVTRRFQLGTWVATEYLYDSYTSACRQRGLRPKGREEFGKACTQMFGPAKRPNKPDEETDRGQAHLGWDRRPRGYSVPESESWQEKLDERLGIPKQKLIGQDRKNHE